MKKLNKATLLIISSLLVLALTLAATFSWFPRVSGYDSTQYGYLNLNTTAQIKYSGLTVTTSKTTMVDGELSQEGQVSLEDGAKVTVPAKGTVYFRTVITNKQAGTINVSLTRLKLTNADNNISVSLLSPMKTSHTYSADEYAAGVTLAEHIEVVQATPTVVEWYLYNRGDTGVDVKINQLPQISYNS